MYYRISQVKIQCHKWVENILEEKYKVENVETQAWNCENRGVKLIRDALLQAVLLCGGSFQYFL